MGRSVPFLRCSRHSLRRRFSKVRKGFWISVTVDGVSAPGSLFANILDTSRRGHVLQSPPGILNTRDWQHVAVTYDQSSGIACLFLNGITVARANIGSFTPLTTADVFMGGARGVFYLGLLDEPAIYNRALSMNEVFDIYNADFVGKDFTRPYFTSPSPLPNAVAGTNYTQPVTATLGAAPIIFSVSAGALPQGLTLSSTGILSGIPGFPGTFSFTVRATDGTGKSTEEVFVILVGATVAAPAGLVGWWPGERDAKDAIGSHDGTLLGAVAFNPAEVGNGFTFNDNNDRVTIPHDPILDINPGGVTAEFWIKGRRNQPEPLCAPVEKSHGFGDSTGWAFQIDSQSGVASFAIGAGAGGGVSFPAVLSAMDLLDNLFHHIAGTWDGSTIRLYVDGVLQGTKALVTPLNNNRPLNVGFAAGGGVPQRFFRGQVDELSVYDRALSASEIASIFNAGPAGKR